MKDVALNGGILLINFVSDEGKLFTCAVHLCDDVRGGSKHYSKSKKRRKRKISQPFCTSTLHSKPFRTKYANFLRLFFLVPTYFFKQVIGSNVTYLT